MRSVRGKDRAAPPRSPTLSTSPASGASHLTATPSRPGQRGSPLSESSNDSVRESRGLVVVQCRPPPSATLPDRTFSPPDPNRPVPQRDFARSRSPSPARVIPQRGFGARAKSTSDFSKARLQRGFSSSRSTVTSTEVGDDDDVPLQRGFGPNGGVVKRGFAGEVPLKRDFGRR